MGYIVFRHRKVDTITWWTDLFISLSQSIILIQKLSCLVFFRRGVKQDGVAGKRDWYLTAVDKPYGIMRRHRCHYLTHQTRLNLYIPPVTKSHRPHLISSRRDPEST